MKNYRWTALLASAALVSGIVACDQESSDNSALLALGGIAALSSGAINYSLDPNTGCVVGQASSMDSSLPAWIKDNFTCATGTVSGSNYVFTTMNLPNTKSYYYGSGSELYEDLPSGNRAAGANQIVAQSFTFTLPASPSVQGGTKTATGFGAVGLTRNGLAVFNNAAAPGDTLASEVITFDNFNGHPQEQGIYHHHIEPLNITNSDSSLVGIALDGFPIYGRKCDNGTTATGDDFIPDVTGTNVLDANHGHTSATIHFGGGIYHYHAAQDSTATVVTLLGSNYHGVVGTVE